MFREKYVRSIYPIQIHVMLRLHPAQMSNATYHSSSTATKWMPCTQKHKSLQLFVSYYNYIQFLWREKKLIALSTVRCRVICHKVTQCTHIVNHRWMTSSNLLRMPHRNAAISNDLIPLFGCILYVAQLAHRNRISRNLQRNSFDVVHELLHSYIPSKFTHPLASKCGRTNLTKSHHRTLQLRLHGCILTSCCTTANFRIEKTSNLCSERTNNNNKKIEAANRMRHSRVQ